MTLRDRPLLNWNALSSNIITNAYNIAKITHIRNIKDERIYSLSLFLFGQIFRKLAIPQKGHISAIIKNTPKTIVKTIKKQFRVAGLVNEAHEEKNNRPI
jgi:hypothetical protein